MTDYYTNLGKRTIDVYEDVLEPHVNEYIDLQMQKEHWHFGHFWKINCVGPPSTYLKHWQ